MYPLDAVVVSVCAGSQPPAVRLPEGEAFCFQAKLKKIFLKNPHRCSKLVFKLMFNVFV